MTIKEIITASGMTQQQLADYLHIPKRTIESWASRSENASRKCPDYVAELIEYKLKNEGIIK